MSRRDDTEAERALLKMGYRLIRTSRHRVYKHACGAITTLACTSSDRRSKQNSLSQAKRAIREAQKRAALT